MTTAIVTCNDCGEEMVRYAERCECCGSFTALGLLPGALLLVLLLVLGVAGVVG